MENSNLESVYPAFHLAESWPMGFSVGEWIDKRYQLKAFLGEGGMGCVFKAWDRFLNRTVALKFMKRQSGQTERHMLREARLQALVDHDHICKVYEVGRHQGLSFLCLQFIEGRPLQEIALDLPLEAKLLLMAKVADAVHEAHRHGLIHRDIKPNNILVGEDASGQWKPYVMDFGLARRLEEPHSTQTGTPQGTPRFMAPEQVRGDRQAIDRRTDVYGLGATIFYLLTAQPPHPQVDQAALFWAIMEHQAPSLRKVKPSIPKDVDAVVRTALAKEPQHRYGSAQALAKDLKRFLQGLPVKANPLKLWQRWHYLIKRHRRSAVFALASIATILCVFLWGVFSTHRTEKQAEITQEFIQRVEEVEAYYRREMMLPVHDITVARRELLSRMEGLKRRIGVLGKPAVGPGHEALGRAHLALGDFARSKHHLQVAWDDGWKKPEVALAMGHALHGLYGQALSRSESLRDVDQRQQARVLAHKAYRQPAKTYLSAIKTWDPGQFLEASALLAVVEGREADALKRWDQLVEMRPWYFEALVFQGQTLTQWGNRCRDQGDLADGKTHYAHALEKLSKALEVGRSDVMSHLAMADLNLAKMIWAREVVQEDSEQNLGATKKAVNAYCNWILAKPRLIEFLP